jgi:transcriptional regulator with XRE-family HTH domain
MIRVKSGKNREEMAEYVSRKCSLKCTKNMIKDYEEKTTPVSVKVLIAYAELGNCLPSWILEEGNMETEVRNMYFVELDLAKEEVYRYDVETLISEALKKYRKEKKLSCITLGRKMYVDVSTISKYENAKAEKKINIEYLISVIFPAIGKSIDDLDEFLVKEEYKELFSAIREEGKTITNYIRLSLKKIKKIHRRNF